mmetsp:Transcript_22891/g.91636  ORF Transcript_22891/g.91636 Transcript_22891/m.91636 type:complete len:106 (-) Transcript_22891:1218-1535(-)
MQFAKVSGWFGFFPNASWRVLSASSYLEIIEIERKFRSVSSLFPAGCPEIGQECILVQCDLAERDSVQKRLCRSMPLQQFLISIECLLDSRAATCQVDPARAQLG